MIIDNPYWDSSLSYLTGDSVIYCDTVYECTEDSNLNIIPSTLIKWDDGQDE